MPIKVGNTCRYWLFLLDTAVTLLLMAAVCGVLQPRWLLADSIPTGGDTASHYLYASIYAREILPSGHITGWMPEVFGGYPLFSYYFPLPFIVIALLAKVLAFPIAFKLGYCAAAIALPGVVYLAGRRWLNLPPAAALGGALASLAFMLHEQNAIWGGNLLSVLAGEFAYSYGMLLAFLTLVAWVRGFPGRSGWLYGGLLEALTGFSHAIALLVTGFSSLGLLVLYRRHAGQVLRFGLLSHGLAFFLLAGWLWPLLEMRGYTIPNDFFQDMDGWRDALPKSLWPVAATGGLSLAVWLLWPFYRAQTRRHAVLLQYCVGTALVAMLGWFAADRLGLPNIRFYPYVLFMLSLVCGWLGGLLAQSLLAFVPRWTRPCLCLALLLPTSVFLGDLFQQARMAPQWAQWNHSGLQAKPRWHELVAILPFAQNGPFAPRLLFEHDPANADLGSTRTLESLPLFLAGRPVLEGLFMESALLAPVIYQLQAEVSDAPSSPLVRFPARGKLNAAMAQKHMELLHADQVLVRSEAAKRLLNSAPAYAKIAENGPFALYRLTGFSSRFVELVRQPIRIEPVDDWLIRAVSWFAGPGIDEYWPIYSDAPFAFSSRDPPQNAIRALALDRRRVSFDTTAIGTPHVIKMAYHPRWQLRTAGRLLFSGPGFLTVIPQESRVVLEYGTTPLGYAGAIASGLALLWLCVMWYFNIASPPQNTAVLTNTPDCGLKVALLIVLPAGCLWLYLTSPEILYRRGWQAMGKKRLTEAAAFFDQAAAQRRTPAAREEALFWSARVYEMAGELPLSLAEYAELIQRYDGYWLPESLYRYALLSRRQNDPHHAQQAACRLVRQFPTDRWTRKLLDEASVMSELLCQAGVNH
ncbi:MAG: hypothetical protein EPN21_02370 [Methylococcaceae bacterium]|nr:MAG: hypothetical protein EPN21_02370 [Methylococcaceae bacterium]